MLLFIGGAKHVRIMHLCFKKLWIMNLCTSPGNHEKYDSEKISTKYMYKLLSFDPVNAGYGVSESPTTDIGETKRRFKDRFNEHCRLVDNP